jgi:hypothetical protein
MLEECPAFTTKSDINSVFCDVRFVPHPNSAAKRPARRAAASNNDEIARPSALAECAVMLAKNRVSRRPQSNEAAEKAHAKGMRCT